MAHRLKMTMPIVGLLIGMCREAPSRTRTVPSPSSSMPGSEATASATRILVLRLDAKSSVPYGDRDRTDDHFFHGFRVLQSTEVNDDADIRMLENLVVEIDDSEWRRDVVRDADYGLRISFPLQRTEDLLLCTLCEPPSLSRPRQAIEASLRPSRAASLRVMLVSMLDRAKAR